MRIVKNLKQLFTHPRPARINRKEAMQVFTVRYDSFKALLQANADLAGVLATFNATQRGERSMDIREVRTVARRAILHCERMTTYLNAISRQRYHELAKVVASLGERIENELEQHAQGDVTSLALPLSEVDASMAYSVGGKNANLGELRNILEMPIPHGFAITIQAGTLFLLRSSGLFRQVYNLLHTVDPEKPATISAAAATVGQLILATNVPEEVAGPLETAWDEAFGKKKLTVAALRSSAVAEDGAQSFAGQYRSILGVTREGLLPAFKKIMASLFSERALSYRAAHGYALDASGMGMCCLEMVQAKAAGVVFSRHPVDLRSNAVLINGLWGLGEQVVDGSATPDQWLVSRATGKIVHSSIAHKLHFLALDPAAGNASILHDVPEKLRDAPCLTEAQVQQLAHMVLELERHYQYPQDMEWAVDEQDNIVLLQTRPMGLDNASGELATPELNQTPPLFSGADVAAKGVGCGPIAPVHSKEDLLHFPEGAVMLMQHSSPNAMAAMPRAAAIIAETGSLTGHMASICREFGVPTLMNVPGALQKLSAGQVVTVDALSGRVFAGEVPALLALRLQRRPPVVNTPALALLRRVAPFILPLHLVDPHSALFAPANCTSLHDVMRFVHEKSYSEMFLLSDSLSAKSGGVASKLVCSVPLDLYVIDLGGGLRNPEAATIRPEDVTSVPLKCVLDGMLHPAVQARGPRPVNMRGFLSVMGQSIVGGNIQGSERFGDRSYAIVSDRYLNFSSRVGYHYAILDSWCGETLSKNYIGFEFSGGAAGSEQRARRVRCIGRILSQLDFSVDIAGDSIRARYQKYSKAQLRERLNQLGRLLIMTRQMDMLMVNEKSVQLYADKFLNGEYH